ncbi:MAG: type IV conjugative transfer system coupling protein TraD [Gammaproteobacteria bacterium]|nr:type IV conjugative transfer system coupling protein TraD [Gammaproteobacteria bacterium]
MTAKHAIEVLLRPTVEQWSVLTAASAAVLCAAAPRAFMMTPGVAYVSAALFGALAAYRFQQVRSLRRYQRNLRRLPTYSLTADRIPFSYSALFLGRGFRWEAIHTQRLHDAILHAKDYLEPGALYRWARRKERHWEHVRGLQRLARLLAKNAWWNPLRPLPMLGGTPALHGVGMDEEHDVWMDLRERVGHMLVLGTTRVGKTRLAEILIAQDIRRGAVVIVFDPKGDADLLRRMYAEAKRAGRLDQFSIFHLGFPELSSRYNPIGSFTRITEVASRLTNPLPDAGNSAAFKQFAWRFGNGVARAVVALGRRPDLPTMQRYVTNIEPLFVEYTEHWLNRTDPAGWRAEVQTLEGRVANDKDLRYAYKGRGYRAIALIQYMQAHTELYDAVADSLRGALTYDRQFFDKLVASLLPLLEKLTTGKIAGILAPDYGNTDDPRPILDWREVIRRRGIVYVGLDAMTDPVVAAAVGNAMFSDLTSVAGEIYKVGSEEGLPDIGSTYNPKFFDKLIGKIAGKYLGGAGASTLVKIEPRVPLCLHADEFNELIGDEFIPMVNKAGGAGFEVTGYTQTISDIEARLGNRAQAGQVIGNFNTLVMLRVKEEATAKILTSQLREVRLSTLEEDSRANDSSDPGSPVDFTSSNADRLGVERVPTLSTADFVELPKGQAFALVEGRLHKLRIPLAAQESDAALPASIQAMANEMEQRYATAEDWWLPAWGKLAAEQPPSALMGNDAAGRDS